MGTTAGNSNIPDEGRVAWVDYAKGICIIMVVMMHTTLGVEKAVGGVEGWMHEVIAFATPFRMPDFFLISGLFLARVIDRDWRTYLDRKVVHFAYFYLVWILIQWAMKSLGPALLSGDFAGVGYYLVTAIWDPPGTMWFIYILPIFFVLTKLMRPLPPALVIGAAAALHLLPHEMSWFIGHEFCERFVFFVIGYYAAGRVFAFASLVDANRLLALAGLSAWALVNGTLVALGLAMLPGVSLVLGLAGAMAVVAVSVLLSRLEWTSPLRYCGKNSLVIYLAFFISMAGLRTIILKYGLIEDIGTISLLITVASVVTPLILHALVRGTPLRFLFERPAFARLRSASPSRIPAPAH